jgi:glyoxylase-like metal-dependent hydrolase (beta-lactamase superfamily II)
LNKAYYKFMVGNLECISINDGTIIVPDTITPKPFNPRDPKSGLEMGMNSLLIKAGGRKILVDTGCGRWFGEKSGKLVDNLKAAGTGTSEIDTVVITHGHGDHIGANADAEGRPVFPNARYVFHRKEWEYWTNRLEEPMPGPESAASMTKQCLTPIRDRVELIEDKASIAPGVEAVLTPGHTPGHIMLYVTSGQERLCCFGDLIHHPLELARPELFTIFDVDPKEATAVRIRIPPRLADPGLLLWSCHLDFPGLGHFAREGEKVVWQPISVE